MKCKCCNKKTDLRMGFCFNCATAESIIYDGTYMNNIHIKKIDGYSISMNKLKEILKIYNVIKN